MLTHDEIHSRLLSLFPEEQPESGVRLVSRHFNAALQLPEGRAHIFIPDCHLLTPEDAGCYPRYHFTLPGELERFLKGMAELKAGHRGEVAVWQTGDLFDLWRARGNRGDKIELDAITARHSSLVGLLMSSPPVGVRAELIAGNHDYALHMLSEWAARRFAIVENSPGKGDILVLHGDVFDAVERLPIGLKEFGVRMATWISAGQHELDQEDQEILAAVNRSLPDGDTRIGCEPDLVSGSPAPPDDDSTNVVFPDRPGTRPEGARFFDGAREVALALREHGHDVRTVVMGHTHFARIVAGDRGDGTPFALMDCGAWFEKCRLSGTEPWIWSAQVGVLLGSDLRIYQVGAKKA